MCQSKPAVVIVCVGEACVSVCSEQTQPRTAQEFRFPSLLCQAEVVMQVLLGWDLGLGR